MFTPYHAIMFGILLITGSASIFQMSEGENGLRKNQSKISKNCYFFIWIIIEICMIKTQSFLLNGPKNLI